jgi:hypothetical protein
MTRSRRTPSARLSPRDRLLFEAGIKLGGVFHQYLGIPVTRRTSGSLARAIEAAVGLQPFVRRVRVSIRTERAGPMGRGRFAYRYLVPEMLDVTVELVDGRTTVVANLAHRPDLRYPLMKVVRVQGPARERAGSRPIRAPSRRR